MDMYGSIPPTARCKSLKTKHKRKTAHPLPISGENIQIEARFINSPPPPLSLRFWPDILSHYPSTDPAR